MRLIIEFPNSEASEKVYPHSLYVFIHSVIAGESIEDQVSLESLVFNTIYQIDSYHSVDKLVYISAKTEEAIVRILLSALTKFVHHGLISDSTMAHKCARCKTVEQLAHIWSILVFNEIAPQVVFRKQYLFDVHWNTPGCKVQMQPVWGTSKEDVHGALFNLYGIVEIHETRQLELE